MQTETENRKAPADRGRELGTALEILAAIPHPLLILDADRRVLAANPAFHQTFQTTDVEVAGKRLFDLGAGEWDHPELHRLLGQVRTLDPPAEAITLALEVPRLGSRSLQITVRTLAAEKPQTLLCIEDLTERQALRHRNREYMKQLRHDLRTPLTIVFGALERLKQEDLTPIQDHCLELANEGAKSMLDLIATLRDDSEQRK